MPASLVGSACTTTDLPRGGNSSPVAPALLLLLVEAEDRHVEEDGCQHAADEPRQHVPARRVGGEEPGADDDAQDQHVQRAHHSHSIVPGGLDVMSSTTRLTSRISPIMREAICSSRS